MPLQGHDTTLYDRALNSYPTPSLSLIFHFSILNFQCLSYLHSR